MRRWFDTSSNWDTPPTQTAGKISGGDTVIACGTFTQALNVRASGIDDNNRITIQLENSAAKISLPACSESTGCISLLSRSFITIDCNNGIIESTDNGELLGTDLDSRGIHGSSASDVTVKRCNIRNQYVRPANSTNGQRRGHGIIWNSGSRVVFEDITCNHAEQCITYSYGLANADLTFRRIIATNVADMIFLAQSSMTAGNVLSGTVLVEDSQFTVSNTWSCCGLIHVDGLQFAAQDDGVATTEVSAAIIIRRNSIGGNWSQDSTGAIFFEADGNGKYTGDRDIYNNVLYAVDSKPGTGFCLCVAKPAGSTGARRFYNNTILGRNTNTGTGAADGIGLQNGTGADLDSGVEIRNNVFYGLSQVMSFQGTITGSVINNNLYDNYNAANGFVVGGVNKTWAQWQALGHDANSVEGQEPLLAVNGSLGAGSPAIGAGANLGATWNTDKVGTPRGAAWDIGAFQGLAPLPTVQQGGNIVAPGVTIR